MTLFRKFVLAGLITNSLTIVASASSITTAAVFTNTPNPGDASDPANYNTSVLPYATFTIGSAGINFQNNNNVSVATFLNNPVFGPSHNGFSSSTLVNPSGSTGTELIIQGFLTLASGSNSFVVGHDDGVVLTVAGNTVVNQPGGSSFTQTPFNVNNPSAAGDYAFTLRYSECCGSPEDLVFSVNGTSVGTAVTPEPSSLALLGTGLLSVYGAYRRRLRAS